MRKERHDGLATLYCSHLTRFRATLRKNLARSGSASGLSAEDIDDAIHDAFAQVLTLNEVRTAKIRRPVAYMLATARNAFIDMVRWRAAHSLEEMVPVPDQGPCLPPTAPKLEVAKEARVGRASSCLLRRRRYSEPRRSPLVSWRDENRIGWCGSFSTVWRSQRHSLLCRMTLRNERERV
jgi:DNA-directed RNA polymerase specialized sigma24 family protein